MFSPVYYWGFIEPICPKPRFRVFLCENAHLDAAFIVGMSLHIDSRTVCNVDTHHRVAMPSPKWLDSIAYSGAYSVDSLITNLAA